MKQNDDFISGWYAAIAALEALNCTGAGCWQRAADHLLAEAPDGGLRAIHSMDSAAARLGISRRSLERYIAAGRIEGTRIGGRLRFTEAELDRFQTAQQLRHDLLF